AWPVSVGERLRHEFEPVRMEVRDYLRHLTSKFLSRVGEEFTRDPFPNNFILWSERVAIASRPSPRYRLPWKGALPARIGVGQNQVVDPHGIEPIELLCEHAAPREAKKVRPPDTCDVEKFGERLRPLSHGERFRWV